MASINKAQPSPILSLEGFSIFSIFGFHPWWPWGRCDEIHGISLGIIGDDRGRRYEIFVDNWAFVGSLNLNELLKERMWSLYDDK